MPNTKNNALFLVALTLCVCLLMGAYQFKRIQTKAGIPEVVVEISETGITVPRSAPSGVVAVVFRNTTRSVQSPGLLRLKEGVTVEEFTEAYSMGPQTATPLISLLGGQNIWGGESIRVVWDLKAGSYLAVNFSGDPPALASFEVLASDMTAARPPKTDVLVELHDFVFEMPLTVDAGMQTWEIMDTGSDWHEMTIVKLKEGMTGFDLLFALNARDSAGLAPVYEEIFFWSAMSHGERAWVNVDLKPGSYIVLCSLPDFEDGLSHFHKGMISRLEVK